MEATIWKEAELGMPPNPFFQAPQLLVLLHRAITFLGQSLTSSQNQEDLKRQLQMSEVDKAAGKGFTEAGDAKFKEQKEKK